MQQPAAVPARSDSAPEMACDRATGRGGQGARASAADLDRFWAKVDRSGGPDACHPWTRRCNPKGYGQFRYDVQMRQAHRWILGQQRGAPLRWDDELKEEACHNCDNPPCCNLAHLYVGTRASNMADCSERGRSAQSNRTA